MYEIAICDDQLPICQDIRQRVSDILLKRDIDIKIHIYTTGKALLEETITFDIIFMDIELKDENGFDVIRTYMESRESKIIFLTSHVEEMHNGYRVHAHRFLTKPIVEKYFFEAVDSAINEMLSEKRLLVSNQDQQWNIRASEIIYVEAAHRKALVRTQHGIFTADRNMEDMIGYLNLPQFFHTHRSYIVNMDYIRLIDKQELLMENGERIKISRGKINLFQDKFFAYVRSKSNGL